MAQDFVSTAASSNYNLLQFCKDTRENEAVLRSQFSGTSFPDNPVTGQPCYRTDMIPAKLFIFNGTNWVEASAASTVSTDILNCYGTMKSLYDRLNTSLNPDGTLKTNVVSNISEWLSNISLNPVYISANSFTVSGDYTGVFTTGRAVKSISADNVIQYSFVVSSVYDATTKLTTVTLTANVLDNTLSEIEYGTVQFSALSPGGGNLQGAINETTVSLASAATMNIGVAAGNVITVTGNTTITAFDTAQAGTRRTLKFTQALIVTYSANSLILPGAANITVSPGDIMEFISEGSGVWQCVNYAPSVGYATVPQMVSAVPTGTGHEYYGDKAPAGYLLCDGSAVSRTTYANLFAIIGTKWGTGDGSTTFNLPDRRKRVGVGLDSTDTDFAALGNTGGEKAHALTIPEIPSHGHTGTGTTDSQGNHVHTLPFTNGNSDQTSYSLKIPNTIYYAPDYNSGSAGAHAHNVTVSIANTGGGGAHNNMQPYIVVNYIIKY